MIIENLDLFEFFGIERKNAKAGVLTSYRHNQRRKREEQKKYPAMLVLPGGAYATISEGEAEPVAMEFYNRGFDAFVLNYDVAPVCYPAQILEAAMAMIYLHENAENLNLLADKVAAVGFSAGGHLLGCISTLWDDPAIVSQFGDRCQLVRPDASVYSYSVITSDAEYNDKESFGNFCSDKVPFESFSIEKKVRKECSPAFIWATTADDDTSPMNSVGLYKAYLKNGVPCELHLFREGWHGLSSCNYEAIGEKSSASFIPHVKNWLNLSEAFLKRLGFQLK